MASAQVVGSGHTFDRASREVFATGSLGSNGDRNT